MLSSLFLVSVVSCVIIDARIVQRGLYCIIFWISVLYFKFWLHSTDQFLCFILCISLIFRSVTIQIFRVDLRYKMEGRILLCLCIIETRKASAFVTMFFWKSNFWIHSPYGKYAAIVRSNILNITHYINRWRACSAPFYGFTTAQNNLNNIRKTATIPDISWRHRHPGTEGNRKSW